MAAEVDDVPVRSPLPSDPARTRLSAKPALDLVVALLCLSLVVLVAAVMVWFVVGFAETDLVAIQLFQATALALGVGSLAIGPFGLAGWWAWKGVAKPAWTSILLLPWVALGAFWIAVSDYDWFLGAVPMAVALLALFRASWRAKHPVAVNAT